MELHEYMILYKTKDGFGEGRICVTRKEKINSYADIEGVDEFIKKHNGLDVFVVDFKLLRTYEEKNIEDIGSRLMEGETSEIGESKKTISKSIKALEGLKDYVGEDQEIHEDIKLGINSLKKQIELIEWKEELGKENEYDMKMIKEFKDILNELLII